LTWELSERALARQDAHYKKSSGEEKPLNRQGVEIGKRRSVGLGFRKVGGVIVASPARVRVAKEKIP